MLRGRKLSWWCYHERWLSLEGCLLTVVMMAKKGGNCSSLNYFSSVNESSESSVLERVACAYPPLMSRTKILLSMGTVSVER